MCESFVDAIQWVMVPNIIFMGVHADGGRLMTKPYAAGGVYINRMTQYCKDCAYDPKKRAKKLAHSQLCIGIFWIDIRTSSRKITAWASRFIG